MTDDEVTQINDAIGQFGHTLAQAPKFTPQTSPDEIQRWLTLARSVLDVIERVMSFIPRKS